MDAWVIATEYIVPKSGEAANHYIRSCRISPNKTTCSYYY